MDYDKEIEELLALGLPADIECLEFKILLLKQQKSLLETRLKIYKETEQNIARETKTIIAGEDADFVLQVLKSQVSTPKIEAAINKQLNLIAYLNVLDKVLSKK